ncbi:MAG: VPLPA-CTERM sorting domain-containing protein [Gammaproteobacteria bacterium]|nr:VPLPA-CTERM sorting domain-containing protein [Gammaproteobacteria bacterium]
MRRLAQGIAAALAMAAVVPGTASAAVYAVSVTGITNFDLEGGTVSGWTFSQNMALNDGQVDANGALMDAAPACINCSYDNDFFRHGPAASNFSYGDTQIVSSDITGGAGEAYAIAETNVTGTSMGSALATNSMTALLDVATTGTVSFSFDVLSYLRVLSSAYGGNGFASMDVTISISQDGTQVWNYAPLALNRNIGPGDQIISIGDTPFTGTPFTSSTDLGAGEYSLAISMKQEVTAISEVPVPAAVWLLGSGLLGLVAVARRRVA